MPMLVIVALLVVLPTSASGQEMSGGWKDSRHTWPWNFVAKFRPEYVKSLHFLEPEDPSDDSESTRTAATRVPPDLKVGSDPRPNLIDGGQDPHRELRFMEAGRALTEAAELVRAGCLGEAEAKLQTCESVLGQSDSFAGVRVRILVETGRIGEAALYCAMTLRQGSSPSIVALAAMVVALNGEVYPGQVEFCRWAVWDATRFASIGSPEDWPAFDDPRNEAIVLGALGAELQSTLSPYRDLNDYFFFVALDRQPDNPLANFRLGKIRSDQQLYDEAKRYMLKALAVSKGELADAIRTELEILEGRIKASGGGCSWGTSVALSAQALVQSASRLAHSTGLIATPLPERL